MGVSVKSTAKSETPMGGSDQDAKNKVLSLAIVALFLGVVGTVYILYYIGIFSTVKVQKIVTPGYQFAYVEHKGPYDKIDLVFKRLKETAKDMSVSTSTPAAIFLDDAGKVSPEKQRSKIGFMVRKFDQIPGGMLLEELAPSTVLQGVFQGSAMIGSYKAYSAMKEWCMQNGYQPLLPAMEIYHEDGSVEYQLRIVEKG
ncbi:MAG: GyrI-like domain-containing protein [Gammaproteobacteria bacterium]|nr:GyrI-like domain-containing protein [Gammaproteobacteria bacterium]